MMDTGTSKNIHLLDRDYSILRDIYEFYYIDFYTGRRYWGHLKESVAKSSFSRRMNELVQADLVAPVAFFSDRRTGSRGAANIAYTLTKKGLQALADKWDVELDWDTSRKDRKSLYVNHHLNILYFCSLFDQELFDYCGEHSGRYQVKNADQILKDYIKPDGVLFWKNRDHGWVLPWLVEYERNSRASRATISKKLQNHSTYAAKGMYFNHDVLKDFEVDLPPVFIIYCENQQVARRRQLVINQNKLSFYDPASGYGYGDILVCLQNEVEEDVQGDIFYRLSGERCTYSQVNAVQYIHAALKSKPIEWASTKDIGRMWTPAFLATWQDIQLDGVFSLKTSSAQFPYLIRYVPDGFDRERLLDLMDRLQEASESGKLSHHPILAPAYKGGTKPIMLFVVDTIEQEEEILHDLASRTFKNQILNVFVSRKELVLQDPYGDIWLTHGNPNRCYPR